MISSEAQLFRDRLASLLPVMDAFVHGKPIQWRAGDNGQWSDWRGDYPDFRRDHWRIKPELREVWIHRGYYDPVWMDTETWKTRPDQRILFYRPDFNAGYFVMFREVPHDCDGNTM